MDPQNTTNSQSAETYLDSWLDWLAVFQPFDSSHPADPQFFLGHLWRCSARFCSFWFMTNVDVPKNYLFRSGKRSHYLCQRRDQGRPETGNNPCGWPVTSALDIWYILAEILHCPHNEVKNSRRLTYDTFWRTFYAVFTTRSRIRNHEL